MAAIGTAGFGLQRLYRPFAPLLLTVTVMTAWLSMDLSPWASGQVNKLRDQGKQEAVDLQAFAAGQFRSILNGRGVFYTEDFDRGQGLFTNVFVRVSTDEGPVLILAKRGTQAVEQETGSRLLVLYNGYRYEGRPGEADYRITGFSEHGIRITPPGVVTNEKSTAKTVEELFSSDKHKDHVEIHARISVVVMVLLLGLLAVPLSQTRPREGRYGRLVFALVIYLVYSNLLTVGRVAADEGEVTVWLGIWAVHAAVASYVAWLLGQREGWWRKPRKVQLAVESGA
ncbi:MAG: LPS export ABC transporter permease LptF, partial [Nevskiales bacterium]